MQIDYPDPQFQDQFPVVITDVGQQDGVYLYAWKSLTPAGADGYTTADPPRQGSITDGPAYEVNNVLVEVNSVQFLRLRGGDLGGISYEFSAGGAGGLLTVEQVVTDPASYPDTTTLQFDGDDFTLTQPSAGVVKVESTGGGGGSTIVVWQINPGVGPLTVDSISFNYATGIACTPDAGTGAIITGVAASGSEWGVVTTSAQTYSGAKTWTNGAGRFTGSLNVDGDFNPSFNPGGPTGGIWLRQDATTPIRSHFTWYTSTVGPPDEQFLFLMDHLTTGGTRDAFPLFVFWHNDPIIGGNPRTHLGTCADPLLSDGVAKLVSSIPSLAATYGSFVSLDGEDGHFGTINGISFHGGICIGGSGVGTITVGGGGTGRTSLTVHAVLIGNGTSPVNFAGPGTSGQFLVAQGVTADPEFKSLSGDATLAGSGAITLASVVAAGTYGQVQVDVKGRTIVGTVVTDEAHGGTDQSTYAKGDLLYADAANSLAKLAIGGTEQFLSIGLTDNPIWVDFPLNSTVGYLGSTAFTDTDTIDMTYTAGSPATIKWDVRYQMSITSDSSGIKLDGDAATPGNTKLYGTNGSGVKGWYAQPSGGSGTVTSVDVSGGSTGLTFSGGPITTSGTITMAGTLDVDNGGTGAVTFTAYSVICAGTTATGAFQNVSGVGTSGQVLTSNGAGALPTWQAAAGGLTSPVGVADGGTGRTSLDAYELLAGGTTGTAVVQSINNATVGFSLNNMGTSALPTWLPGGFGPLVTATDGATVTFDLSLGNKQIVTLGGNRTLALSNDGNNGQVFLLILRQDATGSRTVTFFSTVLWDQGTTPTLTTTANKYDVFGFIKIGSGSYLGMILAQNC